VSILSCTSVALCSCSADELSGCKSKLCLCLCVIEQRKDEDYDDVVEENLLNEVWIRTVHMVTHTCTLLLNLACLLMLFEFSSSR